VEHDARTVGLIDLLYRDHNRIASYYAQLFGGRLSAHEKTTTTRESHSSDTKASLGVFASDLLNGRELTNSVRDSVDPHDLLVIDVLAELMGSGRVQDDPHRATHGALVHARGSIGFIDRTMLLIAASSLGFSVEDPSTRPRGKRESDESRNARALKKSLETMLMPSCFLLRCDDGTALVGTVKDNGMEEPISSYYFRHGSLGLSEVHLVGLVEHPSPSDLPLEGPLIATSQVAADALSAMVLPVDGVRVTPLVLYREVP
jgi:hypothetical protein